jgi:hypothetical protein
LATKVTVSVKKPSYQNASKAIPVVFAAAGETSFSASYSMSMTRVPSIEGGTERRWNEISEQRMSIDGHHVLWEGTPPSADNIVDLDKQAGKFSFNKNFELSLQVSCAPGEPCVEDGDTVNTLVTAASDGLVSEMMISASIEALGSCDYSEVAVFSDQPNLLPSGLVRVQVTLNDVDKAPVKYTRVETEFRWNGRLFPAVWGRGKNSYSAEVPKQWLDVEGEYTLTVAIRNGWSLSKGPTEICTIFRRTIVVKEGPSTTWILVGASTAALLVVGPLALVVRKRHANLQAIMAMLLTEMGMLVLSICTALANLVTDGIVFGKIARGELAVPSDIYTVVYAVLLCFGVAATALSIGYRIRNARLMKVQLQELARQGQAAATTAAQRQAQQHWWELVQTHRTKVTLSLSLASVAAQGVLAT